MTVVPNDSGHTCSTNSKSPVDAVTVSGVTEAL